MSGLDIQAKVIAGLGKAAAATGEIGLDVVYLNVITFTGGDGTPINPPTETITQIELVDAIFQSYNANLIDGTLIQAGDRKLVSNGTIEINQNDTISVGTDNYIAIAVDKKNPAGVPLAYIAQLRLQ